MILNFGWRADFRGARSPGRADSVPRTWFESSLGSAEERAGEGRPGPN